MQRYDDPNQLVRVAAGEQFAIALAGNPSTGYTWQAGVDPRHLELLSQRFEAAGEGVGSGGQEVFEFRALTTGETGIACEYRRPWDREARDAKRFQIEIK